MSVSHRWFRSGNHILAGRLHLPDGRCSNTGVVIVPPFGWEEICSHRPLRFAAEDLASSGIPVLRFDLPGTGDSTGDAHSPDLLNSWIHSVSDAAEELRNSTGVERIAVAGIRLGGLLALAAVSGAANLQDLILWGATATGKAILRELRALHQLEESVDPPAAPLRDPASADLEIVGFVFSDETRTSLLSLDFSILPRMDGRRILVLTRDELPADERLVSALHNSGACVEVAAGQGYSAMVAQPNAATPPHESAASILTFLEKAPNFRSQGAKVQPIHSRQDATLGDIHEEVMIPPSGDLDAQTRSIHGLICERRDGVLQSDLGIIFLNAGAVWHIGPNRMWVTAARHWAARGVPSVRLDFTGVGESAGAETLDVDALYEGAFASEVELAMAALRTRLGIARFAVLGLCSGAYWAFHTAIRNKDIALAMLLNARLFFWDPEIDRRRLLRRTVKGLADTQTWQRLWRGGIGISRIHEGAQAILHNIRRRKTTSEAPLQIHPEKMAEALASIERNGSRLTLVFTEGEPLLQEMEQESHLPPESSRWMQCFRISGGGHTFRPVWAQELIRTHIDRELELIVRSNLSAGNSRAAATSL